MYQLVILMKGLNIVAAKSLERICTAKTRMLLIGNAFKNGVEMDVRVTMNFS